MEYVLVPLVLSFVTCVRYSHSKIGGHLFSFTFRSINPHKVGLLYSQGSSVDMWHRYYSMKNSGLANYLSHPCL
jgi:hypothetical protein